MWEHLPTLHQLALESHALMDHAKELWEFKEQVISPGFNGTGKEPEELVLEGFEAAKEFVGDVKAEMVREDSEQEARLAEQLETLSPARAAAEQLLESDQFRHAGFEGKAQQLDEFFEQRDALRQEGLAQFDADIQDKLREIDAGVTDVPSTLNAARLHQAADQELQLLRRESQQEFDAFKDEMVGRVCRDEAAKTIREEYIDRVTDAGMATGAIDTMTQAYMEAPATAADIDARSAENAARYHELTRIEANDNTRSGPEAPAPAPAAPQLEVYTTVYGSGALGFDAEPPPPPPPPANDNEQKLTR